MGEVESELQGHALFQDKMNRLNSWMLVTLETLSLRGPEESQVKPSL